MKCRDIIFTFLDFIVTLENGLEKTLLELGIVSYFEHATGARAA